MSEERTTVAIPKDLYKEFKIETVRRDIEVRDATAEAIELWLKSKAKQTIKRLQPA